MKSPNQEPDDAYLNLVFNEGTPEQSEFKLTRFNSTLFTFVGKTVLSNCEIDNQNFNHIFLQTGETENGFVGSYMFSQNPVFHDIAKFMLKHGFPAVLNHNTVPECDRQAWERAQVIDVGDFIPDDWQ